jgi:isoquinoline 1-oxidoreductase subunit beta
VTTRRAFLRTTSLTGAVLLLDIGKDAVAASPAASFTPIAHVRIDTDGTTTLFVDKVEMGQGVRTSLATILAEELDADWTRVRVETAQPGSAFPNMHTAGSGSVSDAWRGLRQAGASARAMLVAAAARTWRVPAASCRTEAGAVFHDASGRRLDYGRLSSRAAQVLVPAKAPLKTESEFRIVGRPRLRVDGPAIVTGTALYAADIRIPGLKFATLVRCPVEGGTLRSWDAAEARARPGVRGVLAISNGVAVVADCTWAALKGREALRVEWNPGRNAGFSTAALREERLAAARRGGTVARDDGDVAGAFKNAAQVLEAEYEDAYQAHASVETLACVADVSAERCEIWVGTQSPNRARSIAAEVCGLPEERVVVHVTLLGGAFGRRIANDFVREAVEIAKLVRSPVQLLWTRGDDTHHDYFHPAQNHVVRAALDATGALVGLQHSAADSSLTMFGEPDRNDPETFQHWGAHDNPYAIPALRTDLALFDSPVRTGAWRSVAYPPSVFARESFIDEIAHATRRDAVELRRGLLSEPRMAQIPGGRPLDRHRLRRVLEEAAERSGWGSPLPAGRGRGIACNAYHRSTCVAQAAEVTASLGQLRIDRIVSVVDCGTVVNPLGAAGQVESAIAWGLTAALKSEITIRNGRVEQSSYRDYPVLRIDEMPEVEVHFVHTPDAPARGLGEQCVPTVAPAVMNALFAATGRRVRRLPYRSIA